MQGRIFTHDFEIVRGNPTLVTALAAASYPASGSFVDVRGVERVHILIHLGAIADAITFTVQEVSAVDGTPAGLATALAHTVATNDDEEFVYFCIETAHLTEEFLTVTVSGVTGSNYADILYILEPNSKPVDNTAAIPAASQHLRVG